MRRHISFCQGYPFVFLFMELDSYASSAAKYVRRGLSSLHKYETRDLRPQRSPMKSFLIGMQIQRYLLLCEM